jgi:alpha,alpha-trehalose phosphorylase
VQPGLIPAPQWAGVEGSVGQAFQAQLHPGDCITLDKFIAWAPGSEGEDAALLAAAQLGDALALGLDTLQERHAAAWRHFWHGADLAVLGDPTLERALRFNLFHVRQSAPSDGRHGLAAKGLTGEGYEGHVFWDTEAFVLPVLQMTAPSLVRASLDWRVSCLELARLHSQELNHPHGALYPWRTIGGEEGSSYFLSGSAQYHINAAIAFALRLHHLGSGEQILAEPDAAMLFETARIWMQIGHFEARRGGSFCIHGVTGPDEYSALVSNDHYTNRMAQLHLRFAAHCARTMAMRAPGAYRALHERLQLRDREPESWQRAADAMYLEVDAALGVHPQDDSFLDRPLWSGATGSNDGRPLLLHYHPLTLYRNRVCKQPSVVLADVLAGASVPVEQKRRNYRYYEPLTAHDSSLSACTWSIMASELGLLDEAMDFFRSGARLDLDDLHGNASHGAHMAAMAGSWLSLVWGLGGLRIGEDGLLQFRPQLPKGMQGYRFTVQWQSRLLRVRVDAGGTEYALERGDRLRIAHHGVEAWLTAGRPLRAALHRLERQQQRSSVDAVIFDLDGVLADTAELHFRAWSRVAQDLAIPFDRAANERLKGVDRRHSLELLLERSARSYSEAEREQFADRKNELFKALIDSLTPKDLLPGALETLRTVRAYGVKVALASASQNAQAVMARLGIAALFDVVADPVASGRPKPAPDIFLAAARALGAEPQRCIGVEDSIAGISAIRAAGMLAIGVGDSLSLSAADFVAPNIASLSIARFLTVDRDWSADGRQTRPAE